jgi:ankyrin repeat protein
MKFYDFFIILEGKAEELVRNEPGLQTAYNQGIRNPVLLNWISKAAKQEPMEDVIPVALAFEKNKQRLAQKDIGFYKTAGQLRQAMENLGRSGKEERIQLKQNETTKIGQFGEWLVVMPHTRESSCQWGKGTTWCTAATHSKNLFLSYAGRRKQNIILYYLIRRGADSMQDPNSKISVGFVDGRPVMDGRHGGLTVNAKNDGVTEPALKQILGDQYVPIMGAMSEHSKGMGGKHPAKQQMEAIARSGDPKVLEKYTSGMNPQEKKDFLGELIRYELSEQMITHLLQKKEIGEDEALLSSASNGNLEMVKRLLHETPPESWISQGKPSPTSSDAALAAAAEENHMDIVKLLLQKEPSSGGIESAFLKAAAKGNIEILRLFLDNKLKYLDWNSGINLAASNGHLETIKFLANPRAFGCDSDGAVEQELDEGLLEAARRGHLEALKLLISLGADDLNEAMMVAATGGHLEILKFMLGLDRINKQPAFADYLYDTLITAAGMGQVETVDHLFRLMTEKGLTKHMGQALNRAARNGKMDTVKYLVEKGVKISKYDLHQAAEMDRLDVLQYLVNTKMENDWDSMLDDLKYALNLARNTSRIYLGNLIKQHGGQYREPTVLQGSPD